MPAEVIIGMQAKWLLMQVIAAFVSLLSSKSAFVLNINNRDRSVIICTSVLWSPN